MLYQFNRDVTIEGVPRKCGDIVEESDIPSGSRESVLATWASLYTPPVAEVAAENQPEPETATAVSETTQTKRRGK